MRNININIYGDLMGITYWEERNSLLWEHEVDQQINTKQLADDLTGLIRVMWVGGCLSLLSCIYVVFLIQIQCVHPTGSKKNIMLPKYSTRLGHDNFQGNLVIRLLRTFGLSPFFIFHFKPLKYNHLFLNIVINIALVDCFYFFHDIF